MAQRPRPSEEPSEPEDEVDEDARAWQLAEPGATLRASDWSQCYREQLGVSWDQLRVSVGLCCCCTGGPGAALALRELLPLNAQQVLCVAEDGDGDAIRFARQTVKPACAFQQLAFFEAGEGFDGVSHTGDTQHGGKAVPMGRHLASEEEHVFVGAFLARPFLNRPAESSRLNCFNDSAYRRFAAVRKHLVDRRPAVALLDVPDLEEIASEGEQRDVLRFLLDGPCGLRALEGYHVEVSELHK